MALARVVSFDGVTKDRIEEMEREMGDGTARRPPREGDRRPARCRRARSRS